MNLREYGLSSGLDPKIASGLLNMNVAMIKKMNKTITMNMTYDANGHNMDKMGPMSDNQSSRIEMNKGGIVVRNLANY